ncbi:MAG: type II toxin-antitoxin system VapC family toxin [Myxococcaceae bacterium]|nr:type II toxin-antitoxin system VapC family toxin [Myxococcaceae bacterium]MCI0669636.1 type II toxin-antitoxin system VapC family toxin [Myxococcaceae bacterium]
MERKPVIVLDTHALVWWATEDSKLGKKVRTALERSPRIGVAAISLWELAMLVERGRLRLDRPVVSWLREALELPRVELVPITPDVAVTAVKLRGEGVVDPADALIAATAIVHRASLATRDESLRRVKELSWLWS